MPNPVVIFMFVGMRWGFGSWNKLWVRGEIL